MRRLLIALATVAVATACAASGPSSADLDRWERRAAAVTITRDDWGIAHVRGATDADAVFGMIYAQAEDDFPRIERNYLTALGRRAEAEGDSLVWQDLRQRLFVDPDTLRVRYANSPAWLRALMDAWADGLNYYLHRHPQVRPLVLARFEPWMVLAFTEGSIGGDIESIDLAALRQFYGDSAERVTAPVRTAALDGDLEPRGSNGFAIAPKNTKDGRALLLINPHTSFFFRSELHVTSDEGLDAYGAATWGQFFIYQGFNRTAGWMHTSSGADVIDEWAETVTNAGDGWTYRYGQEDRPVVVDTVQLRVRTAAGGTTTRTFTTFRTHHGPVVRAEDGRWIAVGLMNDPVKALTQSYTRTKARNLAEFRQTMELHTNSSNNTVFADAEGNIAYFHANFIPRRDPRFDWRRPVDGRDPATEWNGVLGVDESPNAINPPVGWVQNTNNWPFTVAGPDSPKRAAYPSYVERFVENPRGVHALRVLTGTRDFTIESLRDAAYDAWLPAFEELLPVLFRAFDTLPAGDPRRAALADPIAELRGWDRRWGIASVPTTVAVFWGEALWRMARAASDDEDLTTYEVMARKLSPTETLAALQEAVDALVRDFGAWRTPWGEVNRFQRTTGDIVQPFGDDKPSIPVGFTSSRWGSLASFGARAHPGTKRWYGTSGNSFVAIVQFGDSVRAVAVSAGGESGDPSSPHFNDQGQRYADGALRPVYFHSSELEGHVERRYRPGE
jgi:acyl-homoserine-lactone acylase